MADDEEIIVAIEPEQTAGEAGKTETPQRGADGKFTKAADTEQRPADELVEQFKTQAETERQARLAAERREQAERQAREAAEKREQTANSAVAESQLDTVASGLAAAQTEADAATAAYQAAMEAGDFAAAAKAQRRIANAEAKIVRLDEAKADLEARKTAPADDAGKRRTEQATEPRQQQTDPVEAYLAGRTEPTANWLRAHKDWITDPKKNAKLTGAHFDAVGEGLLPDTPEYFSHVETVLGLRKDGTNGSTNGKTPQKQIRRSTVPVAPVQASGGGTNGGGTEVRLSKGEAAAATDGTHVYNYDDPSPQKKFKKGDPIGIQEFARRKLELTKQGAYDKSYVES
jgi:hypothetical protein